MNVFFLADVSAVTVIGGAERVLQEQALGLGRLGHRVSAIVRAPAGDERPQVTLGAVQEYRYQVSRDHEWGFVLSSMRGSVRMVDEAGRTGFPDAAIVHQSMAGLGPILARRSAIRGWIYVCHSLAHEEYMTRTKPRTGLLARARWTANARLRRWCERVVIRRCARIVVLSEFMKQRVMRSHGLDAERIRVIPGAVDIERFRPPDDPVAVRDRLGLPQKNVILFTVRNLVPRMGLENLLRAVAGLGPERQDLLLLIGGDGPLRASLQNLIDELGLAPSVRLLGFVPEPDLPGYYQAADLVVMPTHELEGFGLVTVEALACGTPVVGTPVGAIPEILARVDPRLVAEGSDGPALAEALRRILRRFRDQPGEQERLSRRGRELVLTDYTWDRHNRQLDQVLRDVCEGAGEAGHGR